MADYNLSGLSSRSFEQLIQSLAAKVIGPNIVIFGDGPDGGREATFDGPIPYPSSAEAWNGYGVVQAKFLQRPQDSQRDGEWALQQLRSELKDFSDPKKSRKKPEYYIFATNVILTPAQDKGSKDKVDAIFKDFADKVPLKGYDIWDYDKIRVFLDGNEDVRKAYAAFITSGDVIAQVVEWLKPQKPDFEQILTNFLQKELLSDQFANLEQAGHTADDRVPIARVFIDLPTFSERQNNPPEETPPPGDSLPPGFIREVLETATERLNLSTSILTLKNLAEHPSSPEKGRFVLIGGPGQGKTTVSQFICQLFRTSLLRERPIQYLSVEVQQALNIIISYCSEEGIEIPQARRFPVRIELNKFAATLASKEKTGINSILSYLTDLIRKRTNREISPEDFRQWLSEYPWLLILDGLDEVPASSNRDEVLSAVQDFWVDAAQVGADILVIATTRPQGYNQDFSPIYYRHKWLAPLSAVRAMHYGRRLADARYGSNEERRDKVVSRLERASQTDATARLMRSPLQVTIMTTLVDRVGYPPQERWNLFKEYYNVIYHRETERDIPAAPILRDYKSDIDAIHSHVGLLLQIESERTGKTDAQLSADYFSSVVKNRLVGEGHQGDDLRSLQNKIIEAATDRLVFLVGLQAGEIGFEIRSLQEFMAAEGLMDGSDEVVKKRLREIAPVVNWRNVFLFAAGKCFAERQSWRDTIYTICAELNDDTEDEVSSATLAGSQLCLDILEDGSARQQPKYIQIFTRLALRLLDLPPAGYHSRLASLYEPRLEQVYREELESRFGQSSPEQKLGAWSCLVPLIESNVVWAREIGDQHWPNNETEQLDLLRIASSTKSKSWIASKLEFTVPLLSPRALSNIVNKEQLPFFDTIDYIEADWFGALELILTDTVYPSRSEISLRLSGNISEPHQANSSTTDKSSVRFKHTALRDHISKMWIKLKDMPSTSPGWRPLIAAARFLEQPSKETLARELRALSEHFDPKITEWFWMRLPWPMSACLCACDSRSDLEEIAERVRAGDFGDIEDWRQAENRWRDLGIFIEDIRYMTDARWPFDKDIAKYGFPFADGSLTTSISADADGSLTTSISADHTQVSVLERLIELYPDLSGTHIGSSVAYLTLFIMSTIDSPTDVTKSIDPEQFRHMVDDVIRDKYGIHFKALDALGLEGNLNDEWIDLIDFIGRQPRLRMNTLKNDLADTLAKAFQAHPNRSGILKLLAYLALFDMDVLIPSRLLDPQKFDDPEFRDSATIIRVTQGEWGQKDVSSLAESTVELINNHPEVEITDLVTISGRKVLYRDIDQFLLELRKRFTRSQWKPIQQIITSLNNSLRRRTSRLAEPQVWSELNLPEGLNSIFR